MNKVFRGVLFLVWFFCSMAAFSQSDPYSRIEGEAFCAQSGVQPEACSEGGEDVGFIHNGDWLRFCGLNFSAGVSSVSVRAASGSSGGTVEFRLDSTAGTLLGSLQVSGTGGWQSWQTLQGACSSASGSHDLYLVFKGGSGFLMNINWFSFVKGGGSSGALGDVNSDGSLTIVDALMTAQYYVGLQPQGFSPANADVNCDGGVSIVDALMIAQAYVGLLSGFSCSSPTPPVTPVPTATSAPTPVPGKPNIWIHTDMTGALSYSVSGNKAEAVTDAGSDPDDQVAMAMYLMMANRFNTVGIVLGSTTRNTQHNTYDLFMKSHGNAYNDALGPLNQSIGGYPTLQQLNVMESSLTAGSGYIQFDASPDNKYDSYNNLPATARKLVDQLKSGSYSYDNPLYVLVWGPLTEVAIVTKHLIRNNLAEALDRLFVVSHWTSSFTNQQSTNGCYTGTDAVTFGVANCNQNCQACKYMHDEAKKSGARFRFVDLGSIGQTGIVTGSGAFFSGGNGGVGGPEYKDFQKSGLGDVFVKSKFVYGKPDGSDCATFITVLGEYGVTLWDFYDNGVLTKTQEENTRSTFGSTAKILMQDLMTISNAAIGAGN